MVGPDRTELDVKSATDEFLEILISDNAIGYPQDKKTRKWMAGYYNNNAAFRLNALTQINEMSSLFSPSELGKFAQFAPDQQKTLGQLKEQDLWDRLYEGLELAMRKLS